MSLRSGRRVAEALRGTGLDVIERDVDANLLTTLREERPLCVVPMLHGETGEDGAIREVFELLGVPYVGAPPASCRTAFDKPVAKAVAARAGILTPASVCLPHETFRELGAREVMAALVDRLGLPMMVKPAKSGSAARLLGGPHRRGAAVGDGERLRVRRRRAAGAVRRGLEVAVPVIDDGSGPGCCPRWRSTPTAASTTTRPATPRVPPSSSPRRR